MRLSGKTLEGTKHRWKACAMHGGPFQTSNPLSIFVGSTQVEDGTHILGLTIRGQNRERWQRKSNGFHMRVWTRAGR